MALTTAASATPCRPPPGFIEAPMPNVAPVEWLVSRTEETIVNRPLDVVTAPEAEVSLAETIDRSGSLPGVAGTFALPEPGRRIVCLTDGSTLIEQTVEDFRGGNTARFRYVVWNYTSATARPIQYGMGHFVRTDLGDGRTHVTWTYAFKLRRDRFPGSLGAFGNFLFRVGFLDRSYAAMMRRTLAGGKARAESLTPTLGRSANKGLAAPPK